MPRSASRSLALLLPLAACSSSSPPTDLSNLDVRCQPIAVGSAADGTCALPLPSSFYEVADATSATGVRIAISAGALPPNQASTPFDVTRLNQRDGWSPASTLVVDLGAGVRADRTKLPGQNDDFSKSLLPASTVQIIAYDTGERVPLFAEVDVNADTLPNEKQALLVRPMARMKPATRYVAALVGLVDTGGAPIVLPGFHSLVTGKLADGSRLAALQPRYQEIFTLLEQQGVPRTSLTFAWDFTTASDAQGTSNLLAMRDAALARAATDKLGYTVTSTDDQPSDPNLLRVVRATFPVPSFLTDNVDTLAGLKLDAAHDPVDTGTNYTANLVITIPACAATAAAPLPILLWGHGLFGDSTDLLGSTLTNTAQQLCMVMMATDFVGLASNDEEALVPQVLGSMDQFSILTDRMQQGVVNFLALAHLAATGAFAAEPALSLNGSPFVVGAPVYYYGISQGAIIGSTLLALTPDFSRGALNVAGGVYSLMISRSEDFGPFKEILDMTYPPQIQQQLLMALTQDFWDYGDPISFAGHVVSDPLPGPGGAVMPTKYVLVQESHNDDEVPNMTTRMVVRSLGIPLLLPNIESVYGVPQMTGPLPNAYSQWDVKPAMLPPMSDTYPATASGAHDGVSKLPQAVDQIGKFLAPGGSVVGVCGGPCVYPLM